MKSIKVFFMTLTLFLCVDSKFSSVQAMEIKQQESESETIGEIEKIEETPWQTHLNDLSKEEYWDSENNIPTQEWQEEAVKWAKDTMETEKVTLDNVASDIDKAIRGRSGDLTDEIIKNFRNKIEPEEELKKEEPTIKSTEEEIAQEEQKPAEQKESTEEEKLQEKQESEEKEKEERKETERISLEQQKQSTEEEPKEKTKEEEFEKLLSDLSNIKVNQNKFYQNIDKIRELAKTMNISEEEINEKIKGALQPKEAQPMTEHVKILESQKQIIQPITTTTISTQSQQQPPVQQKTTQQIVIQQQPRVQIQHQQQDQPEIIPKKDLSLIIAKAIKAKKESDEQKGIFSFIREKIVGPSEQVIAIEEEIKSETYKKFIEKLNEKEIAKDWSYAPSLEWQNQASKLAVASIGKEDLTKEDAIYLITQAIDTYDKKQWQLRRNAQTILFTKNNIIKKIYAKLYLQFEQFINNFEKIAYDTIVPITIVPIKESTYWYDKTGENVFDLKPEQLKYISEQAAKLILDKIITVDDLEAIMNIELQEARKNSPVKFGTVKQLGIVDAINAVIVKNKQKNKETYLNQEEMFIKEMRTKRIKKTLTNQEITKKINAFAVQNKESCLEYIDPQLLPFFLQIAIRYSDDYKNEDREFIKALCELFLQDKYYYFSPFWSGLTITEIGQNKIKKILKFPKINIENIEKIISFIGEHLSETARNLVESSKFNARKEVIKDFIKKEKSKK